MDIQLQICCSITVMCMHVDEIKAFSVEYSTVNASNYSTISTMNFGMDAIEVVIHKCTARQWIDKVPRLCRTTSRYRRKLCMRAEYCALRYVSSVLLAGDRGSGIRIKSPAKASEPL